MKRRILFILLLLFVSAAPLSSIRAAAVLQFTDTLTNQGVSAVSDHEVGFVVPSAISAPSQYISVEFGAGFSLASLTAGDVSFSHGPTTGAETQEAVGATAGAGVWGVAIAGNTITLESPTDAGVGELPASHRVRIRVGLNAGGTNQITNPSSPGVYAVIADGNYGGTGIAEVAIVAAVDGGFTIGFTVPESTAGSGSNPGGGGVGAPPAPVVPPPQPEPVVEPRIFNVSVSQISQTGALVTWDTDVAEPNQLILARVGADERTVIAEGAGFSKVVALEGLLADTEYQFTIEAGLGRTNPPVRYGPVAFRTLQQASVANVQNFQAQRSAADPESVALSWSLPSVAGLNDRIIVVARADRYPTSPTDGRNVYDGGATSVSDRPGTGGVFYTAFVVRGTRNSSGAVASLGAVPTTPVVPPTVPPAIPTTPPTVPPPVSGPGTVPTSPVAPMIPTASGGLGPTTPTGTEPVLPGTTTTEPPVPGLPPVPISTPPAPAASAFLARLEWRTDDGGLLLAQDGGTPRVLVGESLQLVLTTTAETGSAQLTVDGSRYALARDQALRYTTTFVPSELPGRYSASLALRAPSGETVTLSREIEVLAPAQVFEEAETRVPASGATARLLVSRGGAWVEVAGSVSTIGADGAYRSYVPPGTYRLEIKKKGWNTLQKTFMQTVAGPVQVEAVLVKEIQNPLDAIDPNASLPQNVAAVAGAIVDSISQGLDQVRTPEAQSVAQVAAPIAIATTVGATAAASAFNLLTYLRFLITQPLLLFRRRRRDGWGVVYHSLTKRPIELAVVRLLDAKTRAVKQTRITDAQGRFAFLATAGSYVIEVSKPGFVFPSALLASERIDVDYVDLYHGETVEAQASATLTPNIPIDALEKTETPREIIQRKRWRKLQSALSGISLVVAFIAVVLQPTKLMIGLAVAQVVAFFVFRRLAVPRKPKNWGIAYDGVTRKPLKQAVVRIFDKKYNKLLETQVTDRDGKYAFFAGKNVYYVTADRSGYDRLVSKDVDLSHEALGVIREPLAMRPVSVVPGVPSPTRT